MPPIFPTVFGGRKEMKKFFAPNVAALKSATNATSIEVAKKTIAELKSAAIKNGYYTTGVVVPRGVVKGLLRGLIREAKFTVMDDHEFYAARKAA